jgi:hypothetical protein
VPQGTLAGRPRSLCLADERIPKALWSGRTGGPVAWQPPHRQDEDLVPLTAGACSPCRRSSRQVPRQTSGPGSSPHDAAAQRRGDTRDRATPEPGRDTTAGRPTGSPGEAALSCRRIDSQPTWVAAGRAPTSGPSGVGASIEPSSDWHHCLRRSGQRPIRPAVSDRLVARCQWEGRAASAGSGSGHAPQALIGVARIAESGCSGWFAATRAGYSATARQQAGLM